MGRPSLAIGNLLLGVFVLPSTSAFAQRAGSHAASGASSHSESISQSSTSIGSSATTTSRTAQNSSSHSEIIVVSGKNDRGSTGRGEHQGGRAFLAPTPSDTWLRNDSDSNDDSVRGPSENEAHALKEEDPQRGSVPVLPVPIPRAPTPRAQQPVGAPKSISRAAAGPIRPGLVVRPVQRTEHRPALWFLAPQLNSAEGGQWRRRRFREGFGLGFFGFGMPFAFGFGPGCNPFWAEPWAFGCDTFGYWDGFGGYFTSSQEPTSDGAEETIVETAEPSTFVPPPDSSSPEEIEAEKILFVLYLKSGAVYAVTNYWIEDGKLHYLTSYGGENTIDMNDLDLQKTVDVNAKRGVDFTLKPRRDQDKPNPPQQ